MSTQQQPRCETCRWYQNVYVWEGEMGGDCKNEIVNSFTYDPYVPFGPPPDFYCKLYESREHSEPRAESPGH